jgi:hypothetical protein
MKYQDKDLATIFFKEHLRGSLSKKKHPASLGACGMLL